MRRTLFAVALIALNRGSASAHRLDEYLQATIISIGKNHVNAEITLTPGVAVAPILIPNIDTNGDGSITPAEQHAYAEWVVGDLSLTIDGRSVSPRVTSTEFPAISEMKDGRGEIRINFDADLPHGGHDHELIFENHHQSRIAAYQVNVLVPEDPDIRILSQKRNYSQSFYELDFVQRGSPIASWTQSLTNREITTVGLVALVGLALLWITTGRTNTNAYDTVRACSTDGRPVTRGD